MTFINNKIINTIDEQDKNITNLNDNITIELLNQK